MGRKSNAQLAAEKAIQETAANLVLNTELSGEGGEDADDADEIRALSELDSSGDVRWNVFRSMPAATAGWVGVFSTSELSLERIAQEFGIGRYRVKGSRPNGTIAGQRTVSIAAVPKSLVTVAAVPSSAPTGGVQDFISLMEAKDKERSANMLQWAAILGPIATAMLPALFGQKGPTLQDLTATLVNMKQLNGGSESQLTKIEELAKLVEVVQGIGGDGGGGKSTWADIVRDGIKTVGDVLPALASRIPGMLPPPPHASPPMVPRGTLPSSAPPDARSAQSPQPKAETPMLQLLGWLKEQLSALAHQASLNKDPQLYADVVLDNLPQVDPKMLRDMLGKPDWWATLCQFSPNVQPYPQWFAECREALIRGLDEMIGATGAPASSMPSDTDATDE
jgi:uncharacterized protein with GYD domain